MPACNKHRQKPGYLGGLSDPLPPQFPTKTADTCDYSFSTSMFPKGRGTLIALYLLVYEDTLSVTPRQNSSKSGLNGTLKLNAASRLAT